MADRLVIAEHADDVHVDQVKALGQQSKIGARLVAEESCPPNPWLARGGRFRRHHDGGASVIGKIVTIVAVPVGLCAGEDIGRGRLGGMGGRARRRNEETADQQEATPVNARL